ncbi:aldo/keto reductase [Flavobacterium sp. NRK F10]|uniref:aldo/keto reductase n=1 Tax=Flavobacterium sp. NRK F10 TaxID=2954931 RepID=UPI00209085C9|nr:aldo/keto reductase [Flavobacterium sp. NRK F10]MCO6174677.1 aldo/keto reductase [Flavobacterium sp. NRK F10]
MIKSNVIAGVMNWGVWGKNLSISEMAERINCLISEGIYCFDHADIYGGYSTEESFGNALQKANVAREKIQLITKCGIQYVCEAKPHTIKHYDYSKEHITAAVHQSLKNLKTDYLDILLLHRPSPLLQAEEVAETITQLKKEGKILGFGVSNFLPHQTALLQRYIPVDYNQIQFSATHYHPMTNGELDYMKLHDIQPMAWNPLGSVFREENEQTNRLKMLLADLILKYEVSAEIILLTWILRHPSKIIPVIGTTNLDRILNLKKLLDFELETEDWFAIWTASMGHRVP